MLKNTVGGIQAGIMIAIGGTVFLACDIKYIGALLFATALLCICERGYVLFTGKVGFMPTNHTKSDFETLLFGIFGNAIGTALCGFLIKYSFSTLSFKSRLICEAKLLQGPLDAFIRAIFCGILMYLAVSIYKEKGRRNIIGIIFCIPVFILSGFEHSIANMFYFAVSGIVSFEAFLYIMIVVLGNAVGGMLLPFLSKLAALGKGD